MASCSGQLYTWRKQFRLGELTGFVPVSITPEVLALPAPDPEPAPLAAAVLIEVELPSGVGLVAPDFVGVIVTGPAGNVRIYIACGMRKGFDTLAAQVQTMLSFDLHDGALYAFRGRRGD